MGLDTGEVEKNSEKMETADALTGPAYNQLLSNLFLRTTGDRESVYVKKKIEGYKGKMEAGKQEMWNREGEKFERKNIPRG
ncbi:hypothetical protein P7K49_029592 [Saguinus oedipus]|uniref:Uncharacterized protein n=1 Tax=Saguinus oedipus TaxID=9490 RepID=A0ABQ9U7N6_SAGOE|nr:hypothetical protein P7K49_029592 [Saguinus oedipus]